MVKIIQADIIRCFINLWKVVQIFNAFCVWNNACWNIIDEKIFVPADVSFLPGKAYIQFSDTSNGKNLNFLLLKNLNLSTSLNAFALHYKKY